MKKAEQYLKEYVGRRYPNTDYNSEEVDIMEAIKQAQIDAIEETVKLCAENAALKYADGKYCLPDYAEEPFNAVCDDLDNCHYINKDSILNCADILKKQING